VTRVLLGRDIRLRINPTDEIVKLLGERLDTPLGRFAKARLCGHLPSGRLRSFLWLVQIRSLREFRNATKAPKFPNLSLVLKPIGLVELGSAEVAPSGR